MAMDHALVRRLRNEVAEQLAGQRREDAVLGLPPMSPEDERQFARVARSPGSLEASHARDRAGVRPGAADRRGGGRLAAAIHAALYGVGRLQPLLDDPRSRTSTSTAATRSSSATPTAARSRLDAGRRDRRGAGRAGPDARRLLGADQPAVRHRQPAARPAAAGRLPALGGHGRVAAARRCLDPAGPAAQGLPVRPGRQRHARPPSSAAFLPAAVLARKNIMIAGATNAGKTTLLRALANEIPPHERLITVERALELGLDEFPDLHPNVVAFEERLPNSEGQGGIAMAELVRRSLRMNPSRVIVGEVLGDEIVTMLNAMSQGNDGSLSTIHANCSLEVFNRICTYALQAAERLPIEATHDAHRRRDQLRGLRRAAQRLRRPAAACAGSSTCVREVNGVDGRVLSSEIFARGAGRRGRARTRRSSASTTLARPATSPGRLRAVVLRSSSSDRAARPARRRARRRRRAAARRVAGRPGDRRRRPSQTLPPTGWRPRASAAGCRWPAVAGLLVLLLHPAGWSLAVGDRAARVLLRPRCSAAPRDGAGRIAAAGGAGLLDRVAAGHDRRRGRPGAGDPRVRPTPRRRDPRRAATCWSTGCASASRCPTRCCSSPTTSTTPAPT